jgi:hypothetical protein
MQVMETRKRVLASVLRKFTTGKEKVKMVDNCAERVMPPNQPKESLRSCLALSLYC